MFSFSNVLGLNSICSASLYDIDGGGWQLVRRVRGGSTWHPSTDNLAGTDSYGVYNGDATADATFSISFGSDFDDFLFTTGDGVKWLIATRDAVIGANYANSLRSILKSSINSNPYSARWYNRAGASEDPWISLLDHTASTGTENVIYGENQNGDHSTILVNHNGANVFIRTNYPSSIPTTPPTTEPSCQPTAIPSGEPSIPTSQPSGQPSGSPTTVPSSQPTSLPSGEPSRVPTTHPANQPASSTTTLP